MAKAKPKPYPKSLLELMATKTGILLQARTFADMGMAETAQPLWTAAASYEERIAPLLDVLGRHVEAAASRMSAASCHQKAGDPSRASTSTRQLWPPRCVPTRAGTSRRCAPTAWTN
jgi:hypothetical protein